MCSVTLEVTSNPVLVAELNHAHQVHGSIATASDEHTSQGRTAFAHFANDGVLTKCATRYGVCQYNWNGYLFFSHDLSSINPAHWLRIQFYQEVSINTVYYSPLTYHLLNGYSLAFEIKIGNGANYDSNNELCATNGSLQYARWIACTATLTGEYLFLIGVNAYVQALEVMAYSEYFVQ